MFAMIIRNHLALILIIIAYNFYSVLLNYINLKNRLLCVILGCFHYTGKILPVLSKNFTDKHEKLASITLT